MEGTPAISSSQTSVPKDGPTTGHRPKVGIVACGAIVRELIAAAQALGWDYELTAIPAQLHNHPQRIPDAVQAKLDEWAGRFDWILVGYGDCGTGGRLDALLAHYPHVVRIPGPHCYEFFGGPAFYAQAEREPGTFYLTDFLARHFDGLVIRELGLDRFPQLRDIYFGNYRELLYLRQLPENDQSERAQAAAAQLGLVYREADTGLDEFIRRLARLQAEQEAIADERTPRMPLTTTPPEPSTRPAAQPAE